ncbi:MAG TPA: lysyl oxidase family protein [Thermoleophilaceae bacterium]|nr:lysyl oxidase family protein [Thermoleophilaceae bacterium]
MRRAALLGLAVALIGPASARATDAPDLVPSLSDESSSSQVAPVYIDAFEDPGRVLYRFDATIVNQGGTLDLFRDATTGHVMQAIWEGGEPTTDPDPDAPPPAGDDVAIEDRDSSGAHFEYVFEIDHDHWHFMGAARYTLLLPDGGTRPSDKVGFCMLDSFDTVGVVQYFPPSEHWCSPSDPDSEFTRMGLSPGAADRYSSQRPFQWVDMAGLEPGTYTLRAEVNPFGYINEADTSNNLIELQRTIPGVRASGAQVAARSGAGGTARLTAELVGAGIPARRSAGCKPSQLSVSCYIWPTGRPVAFEVKDPPAHGTVSIAQAGNLEADATYTPAPGFVGSDSFTFTARDARGLVSAPATVAVSVGEPLPVAPNGRLVRGAVVRRVRGRWVAVVRLAAESVVGGRLVRNRRTVRRLRRRSLAAGRHSMRIGRLPRAGRYLLRLRARTGAGSQVVTLAFRVRR